MKQKLLLAAVTLFAAVFSGGGKAFADTSILKSEDGWTKLTALPDNLSDYYFTIVDNSQDLMLTLSRGLNGNQGTDYNALFYGTSADPLVDKSKLFSFEKDGDNIIITNVEYNGYFLQTENNSPWNYRTHDNGGGGKSWGHVKFTYTDSYWTIQNAKIVADNGNYLGMWQNASPANGKDLALNKGADAKGTFQVYAILRTTVNSYYAALHAGSTLGATPSNPVDMTGLIVNPNARFWKDSKPFGWTTAGTQNINNGAGYDGFPGVFEYSDWNAGSWTGSLKQTISVPNGKYQLKAAFMAATGVTVHLTANGGTSTNLEPIGDNGGNINADGTETTMGSGQRGFKYLTLETTVTTGSLELGTYAEASNEHLWVNADNFTLTYLDPCISVVANEMAVTGGEMAADQWYKFTITVDGDYNFTPYANIMISDNGDQLLSTSTGDALTSTKNLTAGTYYVKSTTAQTLTIAPQSLTYNVGEVTATSLADNTYLQSLTSVTFTLGDAATSDGTATLEIQGTPKAKLNDGTSDVAEGTLSLNAETHVVTATFEYALVAGTTYTITLPAGAIAWDKNTTNKNSEKVITFNTPALFDNTYFIATTDETQYISRGGNSNTEAVLDEFGIAANFTTDANNVTTITFVDNNKHLAGGSQSVYNDKTAAELEAEEAGKGERAYWTIAAVSGGYTIFSNKWSKYIGKGVGAESPNYPTVATYADAAYIWKLETPADHATKMGTYKDANAAAVATAANEAGITAVAGKTTVEQLKAVIEGAGWVAKNIAVPNAITTVQEKYQYADSETPISQNLTGLENGIYKVKLSVFKRIADNATTYALYQAKKDNPTAYLFAGNMKAQVPSVMSEYKATAYSSQNYEATSGKNYPNGTVSAGLAFDAGLYTLEVFAYVSDGTLNIGLKNPAKYANANWLCYRDLEVTLYKEFTGDYTGLVSAINTAEATYTIGFENDEYAPYNNVAALTALANAKSMNTSRDALSQTEIDNLTNTLTSATWTANDGDVDAVYNGNFATVTEGANYPKGWTRTNGWGQMQSGVSGEYATAYYNQPGSLKYGATGAYTMPLAANTCYKLTFAYRSHEDNSNNKVTVSVLNGTDGLAATSFPGNGSKSEWKKVTKYFFTGEAGNYVLTLANDGNTWMTGVSITKASSITIDENDTYDNTLAGTVDVNLNRTIKAGLNSVVLPFDMDQTEVEAAFGSGSKVYVVSAYNDKTSTMTFTTQTDGIKANVPCILEATAANNVFELSNRTLMTDTPTASYGNLSFIGSYAATTTIEASENNYVLSGGQLYYVDTDGGVTMKGTRAYFQVAGSANSRDLSFVIDDGEATEIAEIDEEPVEDGVIYNLAGQVVGPDYKGIAIINGKKVLLK